MKFENTVELFDLVNEIDRKLIVEGVQPFQRPLRACKIIADRLGVGFSLDGSKDQLVESVHSIYGQLYRPTDLVQPPMHVGAVMFRDIFFPISLPIIYGCPSINPVDFLGDVNDERKKWLFSDKIESLIFFDQAFDLMDFVYGLADGGGGRRQPGEGVRYWWLAKQQLEAAAATLIGSFDKYVVVQNCFIAVELLLKGILLADGVSEERLKKKFGHNLEKLANEVGKIIPDIDLVRLLFVVKRMPKLIERRYQAQHYSRIELGTMLMDSQFVAGETMRQFSNRNVRADLDLSRDPEWEISARIYPNCLET